MASKCNIYLQCIYNWFLLIDSFKFRFQKSFNDVRGPTASRTLEKTQKNITFCVFAKLHDHPSSKNGAGCNWTVDVFLRDYHCRNNRVAEKRGNSGEGCDPAIHGRTNSTTILHVVYIARLSP